MTDGPFAETHEQLGGYFLIDAGDLNTAIAIAARIPAARRGTVEIRPVIEVAGLPTEEPTSGALTNTTFSNATEKTRKDSTVEDIISQTKAEFIRAKERIMRDLATTPDDKINWSPSSTARTPIQQVAHAAMGICGIQSMLVGKPFPYTNTVEADVAFRSAEKEFSTRQQVLSLLEQASAEYIAWLDTLPPEQLTSTLNTSFGSFPLAAAITFPADHLRGHAAQIEYIHTIYGDLDWHM